MCGIAGWISGSGEPPNRRVVTAMTRALAHRGPDVERVVIDGMAGLGHRRLSIIDLDDRSAQPMWDSNRRFLLVYNGEIYNFASIRKDLESRGSVFTTQGDSEVLLEAFKVWGTNALSRLNGMFAFALWDRERRSLLLARDRLGKKPLFFARLPGGGLAFASEPYALAMHPFVPRAISSVALRNYLRLNYVPCNASLFEGIESLPPATYAEWDAVAGLRSTQYWDLAAKFYDKRRFASLDDAADELQALIDDSVALRLVSDVPLGAFLSSGVDSSSIVVAMTMQRDPASVLTFSTGFREDTFDESTLAEGFATQKGARHRTQILDPGTTDLLPALMATAAEPLADTSALPMYFLSRFTRESVTVSLSGDGGDECFAGYETYLADQIHPLFRVLPNWLLGRLPALIDRWLPVDHRKVAWPEKVRRFSSGAALEFPQAHASWRDIFSADELGSLIRRDRIHGPARSASDNLFNAYFGRHFDAVRDCHPLDQATYVDLKTWLPDDILVKADRMSMAHSLEVRCPLLDHRVVEFAAQLPPGFKLEGLRTKRVLRASQRNRLPQDVLERRKRGFNSPVSQWLLGPLRELARDTLSSQAMTEWFHREALERLWHEHETRQRDNGLRLFGLITVGLFVERLAAQRPIEPESGVAAAVVQ